MPLASGRDSLVLAGLFLRRGRVVTRVLAVAAGAAVAAALCGLFGLGNFVGHVGRTADLRDLGLEKVGGCVQGSLRYDPLRLEQYENVLLSATCADPAIPPGLTHFPEPGQVYVSPALAQLRKTNSHIAQRYPHIEGLIDRSGLTASNELRAIIGVPPRPAGALGVVSFDAFGSSDGDYLSAYLRFSRGTLLALGLFFTVPAAALLIASSTRLNARVRERQLALLSAIGVQERVLRLALMLESAVLVGCGAAVGLMLVAPLYARATPHFVAWAALPGDFAITWRSSLIVVSLVLGTAVVASWLAAGSGRGRAIRTSTGRRSPLSGWRWALLASGLVLAAAAAWWPVPLALILAGRLITAVGLLAVAAPVCAHAGRRLSNSDAWLVSLAGARLRRPSGALTRSLAALTSGLFVLSVGASTIQSRSDNPAAMERAQTADGYSVVEVRRPSPTVRTALSSYPALSGRAASDGSFIGTVSGPCSVIGRVLGSSRITCSGSVFGVYFATQRAPRGVTATPTVLTGLRAELLTGYVIHPTDKSAIRTGDDIILIPQPTAAAEALYDHLVGRDPLTNVRIAGFAAVSGASELVGILDVFRWGALFAILISFVSALTSLVSLMSDRQSGNNYLQILGLTPRQAAALGVVEVSAATCSCTALALFSSWLWTLTYRSVEHPMSLLSVTTPFVIAALTLMAGSGAVVWHSLRSAGVSVVPDRGTLVSAHDTFTIE